MTSAISPPRRLLADCSPSTQRTASTTLDLPLPLGPTTAVTPGGNSKTVLSAKLLKPTNSSRFSMAAPKNCHHERHEKHEMKEEQMILSFRVFRVFRGDPSLLRPGGTRLRRRRALVEGRRHADVGRQHAGRLAP